MKLLLSCLVILLRISSLLASVVDCNFDITKDQNDNGRCGWIDLSGNTWYKTNSTSVDPGHDHTCGGSAAMPFGAKCGNWMSTVNNFTRTQEFYFASPPVGPTTGPSCFSFWYHFFGLDRNGLFEVQINSKQQFFGATPIFSKRTPQSNNWLQGYVNIPQQNANFYILFHATLAANYHDTVGLDDITLNPGACPPTPDCDLESDLCGWTATGAVRQNGTSPIYSDHTTGNYLGHYLVNQAVNSKALITASIKNLTTTLTNKEYYYCLKFWYKISYNDDSDRDSYIQMNVTNWTYNQYQKLSISDAVSDALLNAWHPLFFTLPNPTRYANKDPSVVISLYSANQATKIAIDDLLVQNRRCETRGDCDFESDFCGWTSSRSGGLWLRSQGGGQKGFRKAPPTDTTTHTPNGWFAVVPTEYVNTFYSASLTSPPQYAQYGYTCLSLMYYAVGSIRTPVLTLRLNDLTKGNQPFSTSYLNASSFTMWQRFTLPLNKLPVRYTITIQTNYQARYLQSDIAIDDISFSSSGCSNNPFEPSSTTPIPYTERMWDCNFEGSCSKWTFGPNWSRTSYRAAPSSLNAPRSDHTLRSPEGRYLLWMPTVAPGSNQSEVAGTLNSTILSKKQNHCLSFWYYDATEILFELDVYIRSKTYSMLPRIIRPNVASRSWKMVKVDIIPYFDDPWVSLKFKASPNLNGSFAIDDIKIVPTQCGHVDDYVYTFDSFEGIELSRIAPLNSYMGMLHYYNQRTYPNAPARDHTTGTGRYFLFMNRPNDPNTIWTDQLEIPNIPGMRPYPGRSQYRCFRFAYQISGNATLNAYISSLNSNSFYSPRFTALAPHTNWVIAQVQYLAYYEHKLVFIMSKPTDQTGYVAIDDLSVNSRNCKQPVECDFDDDVCAYTSRYVKVDHDFARYVGPPQSPSWPGPAYDHTKRGYGGGYLYMTGYPSPRDTARSSSVQSPVLGYRYNIYSNYCISMWTQLTAPDAVLTVTLALYGGKDSQGGNTNTTYIKIMELSNLQEIKWNQHFKDIDQKVTAGFHEFTIQLTAKTTKANTVVAIDDIELSQGGCNYKFVSTCGDKKTPVAANKLCNFIKDCSDGSDEKNCGECDFEQSICGWYTRPTQFTSDNDLSGTWSTVAAATNGNGPKVDGNGNASGHYLLLNAATRNSKAMFLSATTLTRNYRNFLTQFKDAYLTCSITFDYFIGSTHPRYTLASLSVRIGFDEDSSVLKGYYRTPSDQWQKGTVFVGGFPGSFVVTFIGSRYAVNETIAIDNIQFHDCGIPPPSAADGTCPASGPSIMCNTTRLCIDPSDLCDFEDNCGDNWDENSNNCLKGIDPKEAPSCAFERSLEDCGFVESVNTTDRTVFNWQLVRGYDYNLMSYSGPTADHTTKDHDGQFLTLRSYNKKNVGTKVQIYSPMVYSSGGACWMRFFYWNNGNYSEGTNTLKVWVQHADTTESDSDVLFTSSSYLPNWSKAKVFYTSGEPFRFVFEGQIAGTRGSVSLDDVSFSGTCLTSDAKRFAGNKHKSAAVTVILVLLFIGLAAGLGFFLYRKHQSGELSGYMGRVSSMMPGRKTDKVAFVNSNYSNNEASTSTATK